MKKKYKFILVVGMIFILWIGSFICYKNYISNQMIQQHLGIIGKEYQNNPSIIEEIVKEPTQEDIDQGKNYVDSKIYQQVIYDAFKQNTTISTIWWIVSGILWFVLLLIGIKGYKYYDHQEIIYQLDRVIDRSFDCRDPKDELGSKLSLLDHTIQYHEKRYYEAKEQMRAFIEDVSHQIKTPLTALKINSEINNDLLNQKHIQRIDYIISELIQLAKLEANTQRFNFEMNSIEECIDSVLEDLEFYTDQSIETNIEECIFSFDILWLSEAIINIVKNALEYCDKYVGIKTNIIGDRLLIEIKDDGKEINQEEANHIFDRFYSTKDSRKQNGMGIGLNIAYEVIKAHFGKIYAYSLDGYTYFMIELPIVQGKEKI